MINIRKSSDRGHSQIGWLDSYHTFSFSNYYDPNHMNFGNLRVINEDFIEPAMGFGKHPHQNMEIITYVVKGVLEHKDSMGTGSIIQPGEIQKMSAGTGVEHSEFNHSPDEEVHLLQIWIVPEKQSIPPSYEQKKIIQQKDKLILLGSREGGENVVTIHQDVKLFAAYLIGDHSIQYTYEPRRQGWLQLIKGKIKVNEHALTAGDGAAIIDEALIKVTGVEDAEFLMFDLG